MSFLSSKIDQYAKKKQFDKAKKHEFVGSLSGGVGIFCNVLLCAVKFAVGTLTQSAGITADAFNNLSDAASNIVTILGAKLANKAVDKEHPFGHGRMEYISALVVSFLIFLCAVELFKSSVSKIIHPAELKFSAVYVVLLCVAILVKACMAIFNDRLFKISNNIGLLAVKKDSINDCLATGATVIALVVSAFTNLKFLDGIMGIVVSIMIAISGASILKDIMGKLLGKAPEKELVDSITSIILSYDKISGIHDMIVHDYGPGRVIASVHAEVPSHEDILVLHDIIDNAEREIMDKLGIIICIHMDPIVTNDEKVNKYKTQMEEIVREVDSALSIHDFRVVEGVTHTNFIFDLVLPLDKKENKDEILKQINEKAKTVLENVNLIITAEHPFI